MVTMTTTKNNDNDNKLSVIFFLKLWTQEIDNYIVSLKVI